MARQPNGSATFPIRRPRSTTNDRDIFDGDIARAFETRLKDLPQGKSTKRMGRRPAAALWTAEEDAQLVAMFVAKSDIATVAEKMKRTIAAVKNRKNKLAAKALNGA